ncbi:hypothetical protein PAXRUDRAFT_822488 [Paxillus rubicundulus Ve08.2h10]|uniref:Uncharacterized protein n=1 Tax=Paxillus rubicundulus Ve08.2h10 TaxID=930991 RepID=A0A0D0DWG7_9AGAM|nr:hypothetical protein PAXRUDRAFT_822488 [Paxillus rubicundulus Ve08.2h10]
MFGRISHDVDRSRRVHLGLIRAGEYRQITLDSENLGRPQADEMHVIGVSKNKGQQEQ